VSVISGAVAGAAFSAMEATMANKYSFSTAALFPRSAAESLRLIAGAGFSHAELMPQCFAEAERAVRLPGREVWHPCRLDPLPSGDVPMLYNAGESMVGEPGASARGWCAYAARWTLRSW